MRGLTRSGRVPHGVEPVAGDLGDAEAVKAAFAGVTHASVTLPLVYEPDTVAAYVRHVRDSALAAGVRRLVFNTANRLPEDTTQVAAFETRRWAMRTLQSAGLPVVVLCPPVYLDNLAAPWVAGPLAAEGVLRYPLPADLPVPWLSLDDLGAITHAALVRDDLEGAVLKIGGPDVVTGDELADAFGAQYAAQDPADFESGLAMALGASKAAEVAATYRWAAADHDLFAPVPAVADLLGLRLTPLRTWITAQRWATR
uniref:Similar to nucleoside-diphosphate-sugar epimerases n=1 Tax=Nonomuraea gerenzanensis TaxID=93944 RepID=A0A1M4E5Z5_9ACTN|nr:similar to nucleoside-diphosphate-sugar epimerases [Nonomuraea gerenzanensis]